MQATGKYSNVQSAKEIITQDNVKLKEQTERAVDVAHLCSNACIEGCLLSQVASLI